MFKFLNTYKKAIILFLVIEGFCFLLSGLGYHIDNELKNKFLVYVSMFAITSVILGCMTYVPCFISTYKKQHPEKYYGGNVFRVDLSSITSQINVYTDLSKAENIYNAKRQVVDTIMVQHTSSDNYYREIITGKLIPVSRARYTRSLGKILNTSYFNFTSYLFIYLSWYVLDNGSFWEYANNSQKDVTYDEVEQYILERKNGYKGFSSFEKYLDNLYEQAECYYETSKQKNEISDKQKIQERLKKI